MRDGGNSALLEVRGLRTHFFTDDGVVPAVDGVDLTVRRGQTIGLVGESGCGKSVTSLSIMRLIAAPGRIVSGEIWFGGRDLVRLAESEMERIRGNRVSMIFQEPMTSLNPVFTVGDQIAEAVQVHRQLGAKAARDRAIEMLRLVGIPQPEVRSRAYPYELSGGMRQRVMIAMALSCDPELLIADEPTTALDVTIQAQILELMKELKRKINMAVLLITHDLGVIAEMAEEVAVMYAGKVVERSDVASLFKSPRHPYTQGLLESIPTLETPRTQRLNVISGTVPNLVRLPPGCRFASRCPHVMPVCREREPELTCQGATDVACWL
ncbi:MAG: ABC transporter ATP-binding protein [Chloroflexi bacterium]|nr:ABC transporter ATP-binding protein [Chloroflexota bacterium]